MDAADYLILVNDAFEKLEKFQRDRESIEAETMKLEQLIAATANMLPDDVKNVVMLRMKNLQELSQLRDVGLTDAIRTILKQAAGDWLTVTNVRDRLINLGFNFSNYSTNPLASVSTTLRRMKPEEVETTTLDGGVAAYRWKRLVERIQEARENKAFLAMQEALGRKKAPLADVIEQSLNAALKKK